MQWHASVRVRSRFEFHVVHSNQGTTMTTDQKGILIFSHLIRDGDISWTMTFRGHFFSKWGTFRGHFLRVTSRGHFLVTFRGHFVHEMSPTWMTFRGHFWMTFRGHFW